MKKIVVNDSLQSNYSYTTTEKQNQNFHPDFKPQLTPQEMLELGVFGGLYFGDCTNEFPKAWFKNAKLSLDGAQHKEHNYYKVNDPRGWFQWYCRYYMGRRHEDDHRQIKRWKAITRHVSQIVYNCRAGDQFCRPKQRQALLHWAYDPRKL